jgi:iron complex transport system substrate-binding protein
MKRPANTPTITAILMALCLFVGCKNNANNHDPKGVVWITNAQAMLFRVGHNQTDSFLEVYNDPKSKQLLGAFFWGKSSTVKGYQKIQFRNKIVSLSAIHTGMLAELGQAKSIVGVESQKYIAHPALYQSSALKAMTELAPNGPIIPEKLANLQPKLLIGYVFNIQEKNTIERIAKNHFPVVWANNHLEPHPLGRAEWIVAMGWLLGKSKESTALFQQIAKEYNEISQKAKHTPKPTVMMNIPYNGQWFVPQGQSYMTQFILDAGGDPITIQGEGSGINMVGLEKALQAMKQADIWINTDLCNTQRCLKDMEPRVENIKALKNNRVYHFNKKINPNGSNPYWDMGCIYPNLLLRDIYNIVHNTPESLYFYDLCP